ncbi:MAG: hypothetical protein R3Y19_01280 [Rikenellaceae bacterium]
MKTLKTLFVALCATFLFTMTSCEETVKKTYYIKVDSDNTSSAATQNYYLQAAVTSKLSTANSEVASEPRTESDAIDWFNSVCAEMETTAFSDGIYLVLDDSVVRLVLSDFTNDVTYRDVTIIAHSVVL